MGLTSHRTNLYEREKKIRTFHYRYFYIYFTYAFHLDIEAIKPSNLVEWSNHPPSIHYTKYMIKFYLAQIADYNNILIERKKA